MSLVGALPAPNGDSAAKALGLTQQMACTLEQVPLNEIGWPATMFARRAKEIPLLLCPNPMVSVAVNGEPLWKCITALKANPFTMVPFAPVKPLQKGFSTVNAVATICRASKLTRP